MLSTADAGIEPATVRLATIATCLYPTSPNESSDYIISFIFCMNNYCIKWVVVVPTLLLLAGFLVSSMKYIKSCPSI